MSLVADIALRRGGFRLEASFRAEPGQTVALLGPNGSGKTTIALALAGLIPIEAGRVTLGDLTLEAGGVRLAPSRRPIGVMFQDYLLFPHMSARRNVAFGLRAHGQSASSARRTADRWLTRLGIAECAPRRPAALSGGQAQRVALARALAVEPELLILDEPLSALDAQARPEARRVLAGVLAEFPGVKLLITHDPLEALTLAQRIVILENGRVAQCAPPDEIRRQPRSPYAATLVGLNMIAGRIEDRDGQTVIVPDAPAHAQAPGPVLHVPHCEIPPGTDVFAAIHPRSIILSTQPARSSARNVLHGPVREIDVEGDRVRVTVDTSPPLTAEITTDALRELALARQAPVWASFKATEIVVYTR